jgi:rhodanese-related sulfurtransferase
MSKILLFLWVTMFPIVFFSQESMDDFVDQFDYETRNDMKVSSKEMIDLINQKKAVLLDIRFEEEYQSWNFPFALHIALPDLPEKMNTLDQKTLYVTACPHNDRAIIAMMYLKSKGYKVKYLSEGLLKLADYLRGDNAKNFID